MAGHSLQSSGFSGRFSSLEVTGVNHTGRKLGQGSDATVEEVEWQGTFCAAKILHKILLDDDSPGGSPRFVEGFEKECLTWSKLSHPHVAQFLGVYFSPRSAIPILLLEKMDTSLRTFLEENQREGFLLSDKVFILLQVVQGLAYLHSRKPALVHHDLSPNNILLNRVVLQVKLTDFGMSRVVDPSGGSHKSSVKGTHAFMSPEALIEPPHYDEKLDVFSFGNVIITILTLAWPNPGAATKYEGDSLVALSEFERRQQHITLFTPEERTVFIDMVRSCLENRPNYRPTSQELVIQMRQIEKNHPRKKLTGGPAVIQQLHAQLRAKDIQLQEKDTQLQGKDTQLQGKDTQLQGKDIQLQEKGTELQEKDNLVTLLLEEIERLRLENGLFRSPYQPDKKFSPHKKRASLDSSSSLVAGKHSKSEQSKVVSSHSHQDLVEYPSIKMLHLLIPTYHAKPVTIGRDVYLVGGVTDSLKTAQQVQVYNKDSGSCRTLPPSPQYSSEAVAINGTLVLIGGRSSSTDKLTTMVSTWMAAEERWAQALPPMKMKRLRPGVLLLNNYIFVFGGYGEDESTRFDCFEVLDLNIKQWRESCGNLPKALHSPQLGVFGDCVMLYSGYTSAQTASRACYTVSVQVLVDSVTNPLSPPIHWTPVQNAPYSRSSLLTTSHDALLIGGNIRGGQATRAIHRFSSSASSWEVIGELSDPRIRPTAVAVSDRSFLALGGCSKPTPKNPLQLMKSVELIYY